MQDIQEVHKAEKIKSRLENQGYKLDRATSTLTQDRLDYSLPERKLSRKDKALARTLALQSLRKRGYI